MWGLYFPWEPYRSSMFLQELLILARIYFVSEKKMLSCKSCKLNPDLITTLPMKWQLIGLIMNCDCPTDTWGVSGLSSPLACVLLRKSFNSSHPPSILLYLTGCAILALSFRGKGSHLRQWLITPLSCGLLAEVFRDFPNSMRSRHSNHSCLSCLTLSVKMWLAWYSRLICNWLETRTGPGVTVRLALPQPKIPLLSIFPDTTSFISNLQLHDDLEVSILLMHQDFCIEFRL